jgi:hypothetical protein
MTSFLQNFMSQAAPDIGQIASSAVADFAGGAAPPSAPIVPPGSPVYPGNPPAGMPVAMPGQPVIPAGVAPLPGQAGPPASAMTGLKPSILDKIKALPLPTKIIAGVVLAGVGYHFLTKK